MRTLGGGWLAESRASWAASQEPRGSRDCNGDSNERGCDILPGDEVPFRSCPGKCPLSPSAFKNRRMTSAHLYFPKSNNITYVRFFARGNESPASIMRSL